SSQYITKVRIPLLCLNAEDDPVCSMDWVPIDEIKYNPYCILATTYYGGHLGWFTGFWNPTRWYVKPLSEYCIAILEAKHPTKKSKSEEPLSVDEEKMAKKIQ
ncbi:10259_t:CDS:2, partial [Acaulospora morrowiae]